MNKLINSQKVMDIIRTVKPWAITLILFLVLRYTGLSGISTFAGQAFMKTGVMDYKPDESLKGEAFDYNFSVRDVEGKVVDFNQFKGKVVFLNLWATWCGPCRAEMPSIQNLYNTLDKKDSIVFVMLSLDKPEMEPKVKRYIQEKEFSFPVYMPVDGLPQQLQVPSIPTTFVIGADGKIATKKIGTANYDNDKFRNFLEELTRK